MLRHNSHKKSLKQRITELPVDREIFLQKKIYAAFVDKFPETSLNVDERADLELLAWKLIQLQNPHAELKPLAFISLSSQELIKITAHMFFCSQPIVNEVLADAKASDHYISSFHRQKLIEQAFELNNPYLIRHHVFALHNRMLKNNIVELNEIATELQSIYKKIKNIKEHRPFYTLLMALITYTLAIPNLNETSPLYHKIRGCILLNKTLIHLGVSQKLLERLQKDSFLVTFGAGMFAHMPLSTYEEFKAHIESRGYLSREELVNAEEAVRRIIEGTPGQNGLHL